MAAIPEVLRKNPAFLHQNRGITYIRMRTHWRVLVGMGAMLGLALAQPQQQGRWDYLGLGSKRQDGGDLFIKWRAETLIFNYGTWPSALHDPSYKTGVPSWVNGNDQTYGIHAALLPGKWTPPGMSEPLPRGTVILWGLGKYYRLNDLFYSYTPYLLWHWRYPQDNMLQRRNYGHVRYLRDPLVSSYEYDYLNQANIFCSGHSTLHNGRLFVAGGHLDPQVNPPGEPPRYYGLRCAFTFNLDKYNDPAGNADVGAYGWSPMLGNPAGMDDRRWYPTPVGLPDGRMLIVGGFRFNPGPLPNDPDFHQWPHLTRTYGVWSPDTDPNGLGRFDWYALPSNLNNPDELGVLRRMGNIYPRLHLVSFMENGRLQADIVYTGPFVEAQRMDVAKIGEPNAWGPAIQVSPLRKYRHYGTSVLLPNSVLNPTQLGEQALNQTLSLGGGVTDGCQNWFDPEILTFGARSQPIGFNTIFTPSELAAPRMHLNGVILPTGELYVVGGQSIPDVANCVWGRDDIVFDTLMLRPGTNGWLNSTWQRMAAMPSYMSDTGERTKTADGTRIYHSSALLLPDGRVLSTGTDASQTAFGPYQLNRIPLIYSPPYITQGLPRPRVTGQSKEENLDYGETISVQFDGTANPIRAVNLIRPGNNTHSFDFDQRMVRCYFRQTGAGQLEATMPWSPKIAPPGWYMMFLVDKSNVPSEAAWVHLRPVPNGGEELSLRVEFELGAYKLSPGDAQKNPIGIEVRAVGTGELLRVYTAPMSALDGQAGTTVRITTSLPEGQYDLRPLPYLNWIGKTTRASLRTNPTLRLTPAR